jgi:hypothetical protein
MHGMETVKSWTTIWNTTVAYLVMCVCVCVCVCICVRARTRFSALWLFDSECLILLLLSHDEVRISVGFGLHTFIPLDQAL